MAIQTLKLNVKSGEKDGKNFWDRCGVLFVNTDDSCEGWLKALKEDKRAIFRAASEAQKAADFVLAAAGQSKAAAA